MLLLLAMRLFTRQWSMFIELTENTDAKDHFERTLKIYQQTPSDVSTDWDVTIGLRNLGRSIFEMNILTDAYDYLKKC